MQPVLINGTWQTSDGADTFRAVNPNRGQPGEEIFPVSSPSEVQAALEAGGRAVRDLESCPPETPAVFLEAYAAAIEENRERLVETAHQETGLAAQPRLSGELDRTTDQLRQAAQAVRDRTWTTATIDTHTNIRSMYGPLGKPVIVFGPNNFPLAFNSIAGGDFAAAIAAGNPVIAKANTGHPRTSQLLGDAALTAIQRSGAPPAMVQLLYRVGHEDGLAMVSDPRVGAVGFTGSKRGGLSLKAAADRAGIPIYLELGSINPVFFLESALASRGEQIAEEFFGSCTLGAGQFCTNPGIVVLPASRAGDRFVDHVTGWFANGQPGTLLSDPDHLADGVAHLRQGGADLVVGGQVVAGDRFAFQNTLLTISGADFLANAQDLQSEVFGPVSLLIRTKNVPEMTEVAQAMDGTLTGSIYSDSSEEADYQTVASTLRPKVGRLLNDKMPTGVAVVPSMNHGGPYPATGHPGFTAVGLPAAIHRFAALHCYDNVAQHRLPEELRNPNPNGRMFRLIDLRWTQDDVPT